MYSGDMVAGDPSILRGMRILFSLLKRMPDFREERMRTSGLLRYDTRL